MYTDVIHCIIYTNIHICICICICIYAYIIYIFIPFYSLTKRSLKGFLLYIKGEWKESAPIGSPAGFWVPPH